MEGKKYKNLVKYKKMADTSFMYIMFVCNLLLRSLSSEALCSIFWGQLQYGYEITHFNLIFCLQYICVEQNITFWLLSLFKIKKERKSRVTRACYFGAKNGPIVPKIIFFRKTIDIIFMYLLTLFVMQNLKKNC